MSDPTDPIRPRRRRRRETGADPPPRNDGPVGAHQVVSAGPDGGYGVTNRDGGFEPQWFDTKKAAQQFANAQQAFFAEANHNNG